MGKVNSKTVHRDYYNHLDPNFDPDNVELYKTIKRTVYSRFKRPVIFDIGCGLGYLTNYLSAIGFDINKQAINMAKRLYPQKKFYLLDASEIKLAKLGLRKADAIICCNLIEHMDDKAREVFLGKIIPEIIKPSGMLIFSLQRQYYFFNVINQLMHRGKLFDPTHVHNWTIKDFVTIIRKQFNIRKVVNVASFTRWQLLTKYVKNETLIVAQRKKT